jgi:predicted nucleic acid-binding protein
MVSGHPIIADAGPLIALSRIGRLALLEQVFGEVWITETVRHELLSQGDFPGQTEIAAALEHWLHSVSVDLSDWFTLNPDIDPGEASSICLAEHYPNSLLVIDDKAGRQEAQTRGLRYMGLAGVVRLAKQAGLIDAARPLLEALQGAGYFLGDAVMHKILRSVGEEI